MNNWNLVLYYIWKCESILMFSLKTSDVGHKTSKKAIDHWSMIERLCQQYQFDRQWMDRMKPHENLCSPLHTHETYLSYTRKFWVDVCVYMRLVSRVNREHQINMEILLFHDEPSSECWRNQARGINPLVFIPWHQERKYRRYTATVVN